MGAYALSNQTSSVFENVAVGSHALQKNDTGGANTSLGAYSLYNSSYVYNNVAVGKGAGDNLTGSGSANNTFLGTDAKTISGTILHNSSAIGSGAIVSSDHTVVIGDQDVNKWAFGLQTTGAGKALQVGDDTTNGNGAYLTTGGTWTNGSSISFKTNFIELSNEWVLNKIKSLNIKKWDYKGTKETHIGPTSEEFTKAFKVGFTQDGKEDKHLSSIDVSGVALKGVQSLIDRDESQAKEINELKSEIEELKAQIELLKSLIE